MPAVLPMTTVFDQSEPVVAELTTVPADLLAVLEQVADPWARRGRRHGCGAVLAIAVCAVLSGARSYVAIAEWAHDLPAGIRRQLGLGTRPSSESTPRRVLQCLDGDVLDRAVSLWSAARQQAVADEVPDGLRPIALDGKTCRGARRRDHLDERAVHLLAALDTVTGQVLAQTVVDGKTNEIGAFGPLLDRLDITGRLVTADALHTQRAHVTYLSGRGAHWLLTGKGNQPTLLRQLKNLPWEQVPVADHTSDKGHGRMSAYDLTCCSAYGLTCR